MPLKVLSNKKQGRGEIPLIGNGQINISEQHPHLEDIWATSSIDRM